MIFKSFSLLIIALLSFNAFSIDIKIEKKEDKIKVYLSGNNQFIIKKVKSNLSKIDKIKLIEKENSKFYSFYLKSNNVQTFIEHDSKTATINSLQLNERANKVSDYIYKKIIGENSFFNEKLAFVKNKNNLYTLTVSDFEGSNSKDILISPKPILSPDVSPNGNYITYVSFEKIRPAIYLHNLKTKKRKIISNFKGVNSDPKFSPDSNKILMSLSKTRDGDLYVYNIKENALTKITNEAGNEISPEWINNSDFLFSSDKNGNPKVFSYDNNKKRISSVFKSINYTLSPSYSDENIISIFFNSGFYGIIKKNNKTKIETKIVSDFYIESPSISKNGNLIVYATKENKKSILKFIDTSGNLIYTLRYQNADIIEPSF
jgi:TolB protein